ncbi:hypothetical protein ACP4OV_016161 [Aristida adscensionis]
MSRLTRDQHARATKKPSPSPSSPSSSSSAAQLLLRRGGRAAATNGESIEFFSDLRRCQPADEPRASSGHHSERRTGRPADGRGKATRRGSRAGSDELLSSEIGKHDYDWLLTPPATPLWSPATSASGHQVPAPAANRLERAASASYTKTNSRLGASNPTGREKGNPTSRLARSSSGGAGIHPTSIDVPAMASSGHALHVRTPSWASATSINSATSNLSVGSTPFGSPATSPRSAATASSAALAARPCRRAKPPPAAGQCRTSPCSPRLSVAAPAPASSSRAQATPAQGGASSPRSTTSASRQAPSLTGRGSAAARSRLGGSTALAISPATPTRGARAVPLSSGKPWQAPAAVKHGSAAAAASAPTQRWRQSLAPALAAARREDSLASRSPRNSDGRKIAEKAAPHRAAAVAATAGGGGGGLTRTDSRKSATTHAANRVVDGKGDRRRPDAAKSGGGASANRPLTLLQRSILSVTSRSRRGPTATASEVSSSAASGRSTPVSGQHVAAAARTIAEADAFPSARYDAMLLREDPKNLTWLRGCDDGDDGGGGGSDLVDSSLEPFYV